MTAPNDNAGQPRVLYLDCDKIADAGFVAASRVVDNHDVAGRRRFDRLEKDVDAAVVAHDACRSGESRSKCYGRERKRSAAVRRCASTRRQDELLKDSLAFRFDKSDLRRCKTPNWPRPKGLR